MVLVFLSLTQLKYYIYVASETKNKQISTYNVYIIIQHNILLLFVTLIKIIWKRIKYYYCSTFVQIADIMFIWVITVLLYDVIRDIL